MHACLGKILIMRVCALFATSASFPCCQKRATALFPVEGILALRSEAVIWKRVLWFSSLPAGTDSPTTVATVANNNKKCYIKNNFVNPTWLWDFCGTNKKRTVWNSRSVTTNERACWNLPWFQPLLVFHDLVFQLQASAEVPHNKLYVLSFSLSPK